MIEFSPQMFTRHREDNDFSSNNWSNVQTNYSGSVSVPWQIVGTVNNSGYAGTWTDRFIDDVVTERYKDRIAKGEIINNPMHKVSVTYNRGKVPFSYRKVNQYGTAPNFYYVGNTFSGTHFVGNSPTGGGFSYPSAPEADNSCIAEAITDAWSKISFDEAMIGVQIAEFHKTVYGLASIIRRALKIFLDVKNLRLRALLHEVSPKELANRYMEARYALRPLMYDMKGTINAIQGKHRDVSRQTWRSFRHRASSSSYSDQLLFFGTGGAEYDLYGSQQALRNIEVRAGVLTRVDSQLIMINEWGLDEPFQTIWELIPFSFVVDWFCNVGKVIAAWSPNLCFQTLASWSVVTDTTVLAGTVETGIAKGSYNYWNDISRNGTYSQVTVDKYRLPNPDRPILPQVAFRLNPWKILDLGVIFNQLLHVTRYF